MDRMEAQLLFGNAIMNSAVGELKVSKSSKKRESAKKEKIPEETSASSQRRDAMDFVMSTLRAQSMEAGDDYPIVDVEVGRYTLSV